MNLLKKLTTMLKEVSNRLFETHEEDFVEDDREYLKTAIACQIKEGNTTKQEGAIIMQQVDLYKERGDRLSNNLENSIPLYTLNNSNRSAKKQPISREERVRVETKRAKELDEKIKGERE